MYDCVKRYGFYPEKEIKKRKKILKKKEFLPKNMKLNIIKKK